MNHILKDQSAMDKIIEEDDYDDEDEDDYDDEEDNDLHDGEDEDDDEEYLN